MLSLEEGLRTFWMDGIHTVRGKPKRGLAPWLVEREFLVTDVKDSSNFSIRYLNPRDAIGALAHEALRMSCAALESFIGLSDTCKLPRSCGWLNITTYYGAYFAAHALLRLYGIICFQLDNAARNAIERVAKAIGTIPSQGIEAGFYVGRYDVANSEIVLSKSAADKNGSHGVLWQTFLRELRRQSNDLLAMSLLHAQSATFLSDLADALCQTGLSGTWLSSVRNSINYRHEHGAWYPYEKLDTDRKSLIDIAQSWNLHPQAFKLRTRSKVLESHVRTSTAIVSICNLVVNDILRHGDRRCFISYGPVALSRLAAR